jgi:hypothetical protein
MRSHYEDGDPGSNLYVMQCQMELARRIRDHTRLFIHSFQHTCCLELHYGRALTAAIPLTQEERPIYKETLQGRTKRTRYRDAFCPCQSDSHRWQACMTRPHCRNVLQGDATRLLYGAALRGDPTRNDGCCPLRLLGEQRLNRQAARVSDPSCSAQASNSAPSTGSHSSSLMIPRNETPTDQR